MERNTQTSAPIKAGSDTAHDDFSEKITIPSLKESSPNRAALEELSQDGPFYVSGWRLHTLSLRSDPLNVVVTTDNSRHAV